MPLLTILSCKILQDEIVHVLENDPSVCRILVVSNGQEEGLISKIEKKGMEYVLLSPKDMPSQALLYRDRKYEYTVMIYMVELALHEFPKMLKKNVYKLIEGLSSFSSAILMFYGLCGNVFDKIEKDFSDLETLCPVRILKDEERTVDDCIGATLGGCKEYLATLKSLSDKGTFLFTPMFAHSWREIMRVDLEDPEKTIGMLKQVNVITGYKRVAKIRTGLGYTEDFDRKVDEFAEIFDFEVLELEGRQDIFETCYLSIKKEMFDRYR